MKVYIAIAGGCTYILANDALDVGRSILTVLTGVLWGFGFAAGWFLLQRLIQRYRKPGSGIRYI